MEFLGSQFSVKPTILVADHGATFWGCPQSGSEGLLWALLSRIDRMAESYEVSHRNLRTDAAVSERGALRAHQPIAASVRFSAK